jgi:hypothetical protein
MKGHPEKYDYKKHHEKRKNASFGFFGRQFDNAILGSYISQLLFFSEVGFFIMLFEGQEYDG